MNTETTFALVGAAGHASDVLGILEAIAKFDKTELVVVEIYADGDIDTTRFLDRRARLCGNLSNIAESAATFWIAAAGYPDSRKTLVELNSEANLRYGSLVHPNATVGTASVIGAGTVVLAGATLSPRVRTAEHCVISQLVSIGHDSTIGAFSSVMPTACVSGDCSVGKGVLIGSGAAIAEKVTIGEGATIGAGAVVLDDVEPYTTVVGVPARPMRQE